MKYLNEILENDIIYCFDNMFPFEKVKICYWSVYNIVNFELITSTLVCTGKSSGQRCFYVLKQRHIMFLDYKTATYYVL